MATPTGGGFGSVLPRFAVVVLESLLVVIRRACGGDTDRSARGYNMGLSIDSVPVGTHSAEGHYQMPGSEPSTKIAGAQRRRSEWFGDETW